jgi:hypothetical protein
MSTAEIAKLEDAGRASMAPDAEVFQADADFGFVMKAMVPAFGILMIAAALLFSVM